MKLSITIVFFLLIVMGCKQHPKTDEIAVTSDVSPNQENQVSFPVYDFEGLKPLLNKSDEKTYIVNFWATWCKPCVEEMPDFEKLYAEVKDDNVELILISLDMPSMWKSKLEPFVAKHQLKGKVVILDDPKMNDWIPQIDPDWGGGIPATLIYNQEQREFYPHGFKYEELKNELNKFL